MIAGIVIFLCEHGNALLPRHQAFWFFLSPWCVYAVDMQVVLSFAFYFRSCSSVCVCVLRCIKGIRIFQTWGSWLWKWQRKPVENSNNWWIGEVINVTYGHWGVWKNKWNSHLAGGYWLWISLEESPTVHNRALRERSPSSSKMRRDNRPA